MVHTVRVVPTMDCEPPKSAVSDRANERSLTGPASWEESEASIRGYVDVAAEFDLRPTLFAHPEVAAHHQDMFREFEADGVCLGLHLHPYKTNPAYRKDLGLYSRDDQRAILQEAIALWEEALGEHPTYFRPGAWSANDNTFPVLDELGFRGGSVSKPGRVKTSQAIGWAGAEPYPHRANAEFRLIPGESRFVEVPSLGDFTRPIHTGPLDRDRGYEDVYLSEIDTEGDIHNNPNDFDREAVTRNLFERFIEDDPDLPVLMTNTHNNMDFSDSTSRAAANFRTVANTIESCEQELAISTAGATVGTVIDRFLAT